MKGENMLDYRVETFLTVCRTLNFTKTAELLNITQPAVSQHIKFLENYYGAELFKYKGKKMYLTEEGQVLLNSLTTMMLDENHLINQLQAFKDEEKNLKFGVTLTVGEYIIPGPLGRILKKKKPGNVSMKVSNTHHLLEDLDNGEIDFAIVEGYFPQNEYDYLVYSSEKYVAVCSPESDLAKGSHNIEELFKEKAVIREKGSGTREIMQRSLEDRNYTVKDFENVIEISNLNTIKKLVEMNCGITFIYKAAVKRELEEGRLAEISIKDFNVNHNITFIWRKNSIHGEEYKSIYNSFKEA